MGLAWGPIHPRFFCIWDPPNGGLFAVFGQYNSFGSVCVICSVNGCVCFKYMNSVFDKSNELSIQSCLKQFQNTEYTEQLLRFTSSIQISFSFCYNYKSSKFDLSILFKWQCWFKLKPKQ